MKPRTNIRIAGLILAVATAVLGFATVGQCADTQPASSVEEAVNLLIPRLGATNVGDRYDAQMDLQALALKTARPGAKGEREKMAEILSAKAVDAGISQPARVWFVRQLEYIGGPESVTPLALLLNGQDAELRECARRALEKNPAPAATEVLRTALEQGGDTTWKIGLVQSLGERGDAKAVPLITPYLSDQQIKRTAALSLAKIASTYAIQALWDAYDAGNPVAAPALILAGDRLIRIGERAKAEKLFSRLYEAGAGAAGKDPAANARTRGAALVGLAKANPKAARKFIATELNGTDPHMEYAAVTAAGIAYGKDKMTGELLPLLPNLPSTARIYVLRQVDATAEGQVISLTECSDENVRLAAFETLGRIGGPASVPVLAKVSAGSTPAQKPAATALARLPGAGSDAAIAKLAEQGEPTVRVVAIQALAARNDGDSLPALVRYAGGPDHAVSDAACAALSKMGGDRELQPLAQVAAASNSDNAYSALSAVAARSKDRSGAAKILIAAMPSCAPDHAGMLCDTLVEMGGNDAWRAITNTACSSDERWKDAGVRALANWPDFQATEPLLVIAADPNAKRVYQVLAIQGVVRLVKSSENERAEARLAAAMQAMSSATRVEDKKLVLSALAAIPDVKAAEAIKPYLKDAALSSEAGLAAISLSETLRKSDGATAKDLAQAVKDANISPELSRQATAALEKN